MNKTFKTKTTKAADIEEKWYQVDAAGKRIGLIASKIAEMLLDKSNPMIRDYLTPKVKVIVLNAAKVDVTEKKKISKLYTRYSGFPGGLKIHTLGEVLAAHPERVLESAVKRMLPKNRRGKAIYSNLYVYADSTHKHEAQQPQVIDIDTLKF
jgi:large subunit ribosomal protein L13